MQLEKKHIVLIVGSVLLVTAIGIGLYLIFRDDPDKDDSTDPKDDPKDTKDVPPSGGTNEQSSTGNQSNSTSSQSSIQNGKVVPIFNEENELANPISQLKGRVLYPKRKYLGGWDYANVRTTADVNTDQGWWDFRDNLLTTINAGTPIGKVLGSTSGLYNSYSYTWFKVKLFKEIGFLETDEGYVRADTVTFVPYTK
jgi:hypothetical protein